MTQRADDGVPMGPVESVRPDLRPVIRYVSEIAMLHLLSIEATSKPVASVATVVSGATSGKRMRNTVPLPLTLSTDTLPPASAITLAATAIPIPVPWPAGLVVKNGSKTRR